MTRLNLVFIHFSIILIVFNKKNKDKIKFPQNIFDNIFQNIEYHLRELGHGDVAVNKKMKLLTQKFYDILLKIKKDGNSDFKINQLALQKHLELSNESKIQISDKLASYFEEFYKFCFELDDNSVLKGEIKFKY